MEKKILKIVIIGVTYIFILLALIFRYDYIAGVIDFFFGILQPIFIGLGIAYVLSKPAEFFEGKLDKLFKNKRPKTAKTISITSVYILLLILLFALFYLVLPSLGASVSDLASNFSAYASNLERLIATVPLTQDMFNWVSSDMLSDILGAVTQLAETFVTGFVPELFNVTMTIGTTLSNIFFGFILSIYLVADGAHLKSQVTRMIKVYIPKKIGNSVLNVARVSDYVFSKYITGQLTEAFILAALCYIGMSIFGFEYAVLISVIIGVTNIIPIIGPIVGAVPSAFILLVVDPMSAVWFLVFIIVLQQIEANVIYPRVVGGSVGLPGPFVLSGVLIGGGLFGAIGMLLALPTLSVIYQLVKINVEDKEQAKEKEIIEAGKQE